MSLTLSLKEVLNNMLSGAKSYYVQYRYEKRYSIGSLFSSQSFNLDGKKTQHNCCLQVVIPQENSIFLLSNCVSGYSRWCCGLLLPL